MKGTVRILVAATVLLCSLAAEAKDWPGFTRGMGMGGWLTNYKRFNVLRENWRLPITVGDLEHFDTYITERDVERVKNWGFDHIRVGFDQIVLEETPYRYRERTFRKLDEFVGWCLKHRLNLVLNLHKAVGNYCDIKETKELLDDAELQNRFVALWLEIERRYHDMTGLAFEILNEVRDVDPVKWNTLADRTLRAIREKNPTRWVVVGSTCWNSVGRLADLKIWDDEHVVYTFHMYAPFDFTHQRGVLQEGPLYYNRVMPYPCSDVERYRAACRLRNPKSEGDYRGLGEIGRQYLRNCLHGAHVFTKEHPDKILWNGEFGTIRHAPPESRVAYMRDVIATCREWGIPYCVWNYLSTPNDGNRFSLVDDVTREFLSPELLRACLGELPVPGRPVRGELKVDVAEGRRVCGEETVFRVSLVDEKGALLRQGAALVVVDDFTSAGRQVSRHVDFAVENPVVVKGRLDRPGFLRVSVDLPGVSRNLGNQPFQWSVPYEEDKIVQGAEEPADFDEFWSNALVRLEREVPADVRKVEEPSLSTERWTMYRVSFATFGRRMHAWMSVPKGGRGPWPAEVTVPGAGCFPLLRQGAADRIRFFVSVLPFEPALDDAENVRRYEAMNEGYRQRFGVPRYPFAGLDGKPEGYFYYPVIAGTVRAVRWLVAQSEVDRRKVTYRGESQGGAFGLYLAGLAGECFSHVEADVPALTDTLGWLKGRAGGWPHPDLEWRSGNEAAKIVRIAHAMPYFDGCNFAARAKCPLRIVAGLSDFVCPPSAVCAAFNRVRGRKGAELYLAYGGTHHSAVRMGRKAR